MSLEKIPGGVPFFLDRVEDLPTLSSNIPKRVVVRQYLDNFEDLLYINARNCKADHRYAR